MIMFPTFLILNMYFLVPYFSCIIFNSKIVSVMTELNTSLCVRCSEHINCSVRVWMRARLHMRSHTLSWEAWRNTRLSVGACGTFIQMNWALPSQRKAFSIYCFSSINLNHQRLMFYSDCWLSPLFIKLLLTFLLHNKLCPLTTFLFTVSVLVEVKVKSRTVVVKGPRGELIRTFKHLRLELKMISKSKFKVDVWFATRKELACVRTICSHIENMIKGVIYVSWTLISTWILKVVWGLLDLAVYIWCVKNGICGIRFF